LYFDNLSGRSKQQVKEDNRATILGKPEVSEKLFVVQGFCEMAVDRDAVVDVAIAADKSRKYPAVLGEWKSVITSHSSTIIHSAYAHHRYHREGGYVIAPSWWLEDLVM
jgi:hypothetical protein